MNNQVILCPQCGSKKEVEIESDDGWNKPAHYHCKKCNYTWNDKIYSKLSE